MKKYIIIIIIIIILSFTKISSFVALKFYGTNLKLILEDVKINRNSSLYLQDFLQRTLFNELYTSLYIGTPKQNIIMKIDTNGKILSMDNTICDDYYTNNYRFINKDFTEKTNSFNYTKSDTFTKISNFSELKIYFSPNICGRDKIIIKNYNVSLIYTNNKYDKEFSEINADFLNFYIYNNDIISEKLCGKIGLSSYSKNENMNIFNTFMAPLKQEKIIESYYWHFKYESSNEGYLIFGLPHEYDNINYKINELHEIYSFNYNFDIFWTINLNEIYFNDNAEKIIVTQNNNIDKGFFDFSSHFIIGTERYEKYIELYFFSGYYNDNICKSENIIVYGMSYNMITCDGKEFVKFLRKFPNLYFYNKDFNYTFELTFKNLFFRYDDIYYFLIIFQKSFLTSNFWYFGIPFLKKYQMTFNTDTKSVGFYFISDYIKKENDNKDGNLFSSLKTYFTLRTFLEIIIGVILIILGIFVGKKIYLKRKLMANELKDDDYDYSISQKEKYKNGSSRLIEMSDHSIRK